MFIKGCLALKSGNGGRHRNGKRETWNWNGSPTGSSRARMILQSYWSWAEMAPHGSAIGCELPCKGAKGQLRQSSKGLIHQDCLLTASRKLKQKTRHRVCRITVRCLQLQLLKGTYLSCDQQHPHTFSKFCSSNFHGKSNEILFHNNKREIQITNLQVFLTQSYIMYFLLPHQSKPSKILRTTWDSIPLQF